jgi:hypothetical protein
MKSMKMAVLEIVDDDEGPRDDHPILLFLSGAMSGSTRSKNRANAEER